MTLVGSKVELGVERCLQKPLTPGSKGTYGRTQPTPDGWVAEAPAIRRCYALMPSREEALAELADLFSMAGELPRIATDFIARSGTYAPLPELER